MNAIALLPPPVRSYIVDFVARKRRMVMLKMVGVSVGLTLGWMLVWCVVDRVVALPAGVRLLLLTGNAAVVAGLLYRPVRETLRRDVDWLDATADIESRSTHFAQRLQTVTSQLLSPPEQRGSSEILGQLLREVSAQAANQQPQRLIPWRLIARPWAGAGAMVVLVCAMAWVPWLDLPQLMARFLKPLAHVPPVTTTRLAVDPGDRDVIQGEPVQIAVTAERLGDQVVKLLVSRDGKAWTASSMMPVSAAGAAGAAGEVAAARFTATIPAVDRDLWYYVSGGDAASERFRVRVLRRPAVVEFRVRYTYPAYTGRQPLVVSNTDGVIEAPVGTEAVLAVAATEPLKAATLVFGQGNSTVNVPTQATAEENVRQAKLTIQKEQTYRVEMVSARDVVGGGPGVMPIHAIADRPPLVRLVQPTVDLRLRPRDVLAVRYEAMDDYGISSLSLFVQVNAAAPKELPMRLRGDARRQEGEVSIDLATLPLKIGDVVAVHVRAVDKAGQKGASEVRRVLVSPKSVDENAHLRIAALKEASHAAEAVVGELGRAVGALGEARRLGDGRGAGEGAADSSEYQAAVGRAQQSLAAAGQAVAVIRQATLGAAARGRTREFSLAAANVLDAAELLAATTRRVATPLDVTGARAPAKAAGAVASAVDSLGRGAERARQVRSELAVLARGEQARAVLVERENLKAVGDALGAPGRAGTAERVAERARDAAARAEQAVAAAAGELGFEANSPELEARLRKEVDAEAELLGAQQPVRFATAARAWLARGARRAVNAAGDFPDRLVTAAVAEAVGPAGDAVRARDLGLVAAAASALRQGGGSGAGSGGEPARVPASQPSADEYGAAVAVLLGDVAGVGGGAVADARAKVRAWGGGQAAPGLSGVSALGGEKLGLALEANALAAEGQFGRAAEIDKALVEPAVAAGGSGAGARALAAQRHWEAVGRLLAAAQELSRLGARQQQLGGEVGSARRGAATRPGTAAVSAVALAEAQDEVGEAVEKLRRERGSYSDAGSGELSVGLVNTREEALVAVRASRDRLGLMPRQLEDAAAAANHAREAEAAAGRVAPAGAQDDKSAAAQTAQRAWAEQRSAQQRAADAARLVHPDVAAGVSAGLSRFVPETAGVVATIDARLAPALRAVQDALGAKDAAGIEGSAAEARRVVELTLGELRVARDGVAAGDPLGAAAWFAREAAAGLARRPAELESVRRDQEAAAASLARGLDVTVREAGRHRLALTAAGWILDPSGGPASSDGRGPAWARPRPVEEELAAPAYGAESPGYREALRAYFNALGKAPATR